MAGSESGLKYRIRVVEGGMGLGLTLVAVPRMIAPDLLVREILDDLERQNIRCGVEVDTITDIVKGRLLAVEMLVARGTAGVRGTSARLTCCSFRRTRPVTELGTPARRTRQPIRCWSKQEISSRAKP